MADHFVCTRSVKEGSEGKFVRLYAASDLDTKGVDISFDGPNFNDGNVEVVPVEAAKKYIETLQAQIDAVERHAAEEEERRRRTAEKQHFQVNATVDTRGVHFAKSISFERSSFDGYFEIKGGTRIHGTYTRQDMEELHTKLGRMLGKED